MRANLLLPCVLTLLLGAACPAPAIDLYGFASYWNKKDADGTWGGGLGMSLPLITERLRLDGRVYGFADSDIESIDDRLTLTAFDLGLQIHILPEATVDPYLLGGISYLYADADRIDVDSSLGGYVGAGLEWNPGLPLIHFFAEGLYRFTEIDRNLGDNIDVSGLTGNVGIKLHF